MMPAPGLYKIRAMAMMEMTTEMMVLTESLMHHKSPFNDPAESVYVNTIDTMSYIP